PQPQGNPPPASTRPPATHPAPRTPKTPLVVQRRQRATPGKRTSSSPTAKHARPKHRNRPRSSPKAPPHSATPAPANNVAPPPQLLAIQAAAFSAELAESSVSAQALGFYRIPLFLLPIYQAAAVRYGVPWQILAAINEIETNYGNDLSVSSAGAVGWMQ